MKRRRLLAFALAVCALGLIEFHPDSACAALPCASIYLRATNVFAEADFFKPAELKTNELAFTLAPLILQEVSRGKEPTARPDSFGTLSLSNGVLVLDRSHHAVYWQAATFQLKGKAHARVSFVWCYLPGQAGSGLALQGIRVTLNSADQPMIWEVLADNSGAELIFVSNSSVHERFGSNPSAPTLTNA